MNQTIVVLLILLILSCLIRTARVSKISTKKNAIAFYKQKIVEEENSTTSDGVKAFAALTVLLIDIAIIYFSVQAIFSLVK
ncbi:hypothetical protein FDH41_gp22 [Acinetobacter phage WCHABP12]|uniref:Uncharacterized protein n=1 Tax=Acinetobacter phage WCHABP12 TaxID=1965454 RepID=A0A1V0DZ96_9CAUD|nr:hypothetical protein FDH41_gp22 [Acinetobacter phage WCHABP12]ARB06763.1 hypothetical protein ABP12_00022 [Acinetobacter phage WCHABP12]